MKRFYHVFLAAVAVLFVTSAETASFQSPSIGARATGMAGAYVAAVDDPLAIYWNPAGLFQVEGQQVIAGSTFVKGYASYETLTGQTEDNHPEWIPIPHLAFSIPVNEDVIWGMGLYAPFGLKQEWDDESLYKYNSTESEISLTKLHTGISYRVNDKFVTGAGIGWDWANMDAKSISLLSYFPPDPSPYFANLDSTAEGENYSANIGFLWFPAEEWSIGGVWRSKTTIDFEGSVTLTTGVYPRETRDLDMEFTFPDVVSIGTCYKGLDKWLFTAQVDWTGWSSMDSLVQKLDSPISLYNLTDPFTPAATDQLVIERNWEDTYSFRLGTEYQLNPDLALRAGYMWDPAAVPQETLDPMMFDVSAHRFSIGLGYKFGDWEIDSAYMYSKGKMKEARNSKNIFPTDGDYRGKSHVGEVSFIYHF